MKGSDNLGRGSDTAEEVDQGATGRGVRDRNRQCDTRAHGLGGCACRVSDELSGEGHRRYAEREL